MPTEGVRLFGIRHHGPGSAHSLVHALSYAPDAVLIEGPPDANELAAAGVERGARAAGGAARVCARSRQQSRAVSVRAVFPNGRRSSSR